MCRRINATSVKATTPEWHVFTGSVLESNKLKVTQAAEKASRDAKLAEYYKLKDACITAEKKHKSKNNKLRRKHNAALKEWETAGKPRGKKPKLEGIVGPVLAPSHPFPRPRKGLKITQEEEEDTDSESEDEDSGEEGTAMDEGAE
jgi:hypothetical protein